MSVRVSRHQNDMLICDVVSSVDSDLETRNGLCTELAIKDDTDWLTLKREADRAIRVQHNFPWSGRFAPPVPVCTKMVLEYRLSGYVEAHDIMMCRILEGFQVKTLSTVADPNHRNNIKGRVPLENAPSKCHIVLQCKLDYPWQPDIRIQYTFHVWWIVRRAQRSEYVSSKCKSLQLHPSICFDLRLNSHNLHENVTAVRSV